MATITFTHEETTSAMNPESSIEIPEGQRASSLWQNKGDELVLTVLGTNRVRIISSMKDKKQDPAKQIPLYAVEEIHDLMPPLTWMLQPSLSSRCSITRRAAVVPKPANDTEEDNAAADYEDDKNEKDVNSEEMGISSHNEVIDYDGIAIQNLSSRSSIPAIAYQSMWPWKLCNDICNLIQQTEEYQGLRKILYTAAGLRYGQVYDDVPENSAGETTTAYYQLIDPSAFANWLSANLALSHNDRLDLLEMVCTVERLRYIRNKLQVSKKRETRIRCKHCGSTISQMREIFSVEGSEGTAGNYVNEHGIVHHTMTLRDIYRDSVVCAGPQVTQDSWFPGYSWQIAYCAICSDHLGWRFRRVGGNSNDHDRPRKAFWGFSSITTDEQVQPRRVTSGELLHRRVLTQALLG